MNQVDEIIDLIGSRAALKKLCGVGDSSVSMWKQSGIPTKHWASIIWQLQEQGKTPPAWMDPRPNRSCRSKVTAA